MRIMAGSLGMLVVCAGLASVAAAADPPEHPLGGPTVEDRNAPGAGNTFGEPMEGEKAKRGGRVDPRAFFGAVRSMDEEGAPADVRPSDEQREQVRAIVEEFRAAARAFHDEHEEEIEALRSAAGIERGPRGEQAPPPPPEAEGERREGAQVSPEQSAAREALHELMQQGPNPEEYFARVWEVLNEPQQEYLRSRIEEIQAQRLMEREEPIVRGAVRKNLAEQDPLVTELQELTREEIRAKLRDLPKEQREATLAKIRARRGGQ